MESHLVLGGLAALTTLFSAILAVLVYHQRVRMRDREKEISDLRAELFRRQQETGTQTSRIQQVQEQVADLRIAAAAEYQRGLMEGRAVARQEAETAVAPLQAAARQTGIEEGRRQAHAEYGIACTPFRCLEESLLGLRKTWRVGYTMQMTLRGIPIFQPLNIEVASQSTYDEDRLLAVVRTVVDAAVKAGMQNVSLGEPVVKSLLDRVIRT